MKPARVYPEKYRRFTLSEYEGGFAQILILCLILALSVAGFVLYKTVIKPPEKLVDVQFTPPSEKQLQEATKSPGETVHADAGSANWKTYKDQTLAVNILYPSQWRVQSSEIEGGSDFPNKPTGRVRFSDPVIDGTIFISLYPNPQNLSLGDYIAMQTKKEVDYEKVNGPNAGNPYILPTGSQPSKLPNGLAANLKVNDGCEPFSCTTYIISRPKAFYTITFWEQTNKDIVNKMLTSLQFTN